METGESSAMAADVRRKRAKHSKTRKGCARCKQRHIKCDETKPSCMRCEQANQSCPGYEETIARVKRGPVRRFRLISVPHAVPIAPAPDDTPFILETDLEHSTNIFPDDEWYAPANAGEILEEQNAIDYFMSQTLSTLSTYCCDSELWSTGCFVRLIADAKIRNAVIAIGLAHEELRQNFREGRGPNTALSERSGRNGTQSPDRLDPDNYYAMATGYTRADVETTKDDVTRIRLDLAVAALLFVIYLSLQDRMEHAAVHMHSGLNIINENGEAFLSASNVHREVYVYFLSIATSSWPVHPSASLFKLIQRTSRLSCFLVNTMTPLQSLRTDFDLYAHEIFAYTSTVTRGYNGDPNNLVQIRKELLAAGDCLSEKIDDYADLVGIDDSDPETPYTLELMFIKLLRARLIVFNVFSESVHTRYQTTYDRHTDRFDKAIILTGQAIRIGRELVGEDWPLFSMNLNIIGITSQSIFLCRHPMVRRKGLELLRFCPQREGILEAAETRQLSQICIDFEEVDISFHEASTFPSHIPEENRLHFVESIRLMQAESEQLDVGTGEMLVRMMYRPDGDSGYIERRKKVKKDTYNSSTPLLEMSNGPLYGSPLSLHNLDGIVA